MLECALIKVLKGRELGTIGLGFGQKFWIGGYNEMRNLKVSFIEQVSYFSSFTVRSTS